MSVPTRPPRVLVFTNMYPTPAKPWWGTFVAEQVEDLRRLGVSVAVLDFDGTDDRMNYVRASRRFLREIRTGHYDLVHAHYGLVGAIAVTQRRVPVVTTFHGGDYTGYVPWQAVVSRVVARLSTPIVVTPHGVTRLGVDAAVIPAGVNTRLFRPADPRAARNSLGLDPAVPYALLLGARDDRRKRSDLFDAAVDHARAAVPELRALCLEGLDRDQVVELMNAVDVGVLTSDAEGNPVAVREALACETPVVSVDVGNVRDVMAGLPGCAIADRAAAPLGDAIVAALASDRSPVLRARAQETSGEVVARDVLELYERVLRGS